MTYEEAAEFADSTKKYGSILGLESIRNLMQELGNVQEQLHIIHVAVSYTHLDVYKRQAAKTFLQHAKEKEQKRKNSLEAGDLKGYTIEAHSLKSNGRLLGDCLLYTSRCV